MTQGKAILGVVVGLTILVPSSRLLLWGTLGLATLISPMQVDPKLPTCDIGTMLALTLLLIMCFRVC